MTVSQYQSSSTDSSDRFNRLRELLNGSSSAARVQKFQRQLETNRNRNAMLAVLLHACARFERGEPLSDLEANMLDTIRTCNNDEDLKQLGHIYQEMTTERRKALFPGKLASLPLEQRYTEADLKEDLNTIIPELMSQPNVRTINIDELPPDAPLGPDDEAFLQAVKDYGHGIVRYTSSAQKNQLASTEPKNYGIKMTRFYCSDNSDELNSDELYFSVGAASDLGYKCTYSSKEMGMLIRARLIISPLMPMFSKVNIGKVFV
ncbi:hypothetical protein NIES4103_18590 [Nostoc sp. NIES-4103]|nr:hypothetical protein NIES4103_18590 [Nostoc sp. NIES-4103]